MTDTNLNRDIMSMAMQMRSSVLRTKLRIHLCSPPVG